MASSKTEAPVIVCGCASEHSPEAFENRRGVTFVSGAMGKDKLLDFITEHGARHETESEFCALPTGFFDIGKRFQKIFLPLGRITHNNIGRDRGIGKISAV